MNKGIYAPTALVKLKAILEQAAAVFRIEIAFLQI
jgi:hypothetical protein